MFKPLVVIATALVVCLAGAHVSAQNRQESRARPQVPTVVVVGCAAAGPSPAIWLLQRASERVEGAGAAMTVAERTTAEKAPLGKATYELIGVADFLTNEESHRVGSRKDLYALEQVNGSGALRSGAQVAVKGLLIAGTTPRINLTSVVQINAACPR